PDRPRAAMEPASVEAGQMLEGEGQVVVGDRAAMEPASVEAGQGQTPHRHRLRTDRHAAMEPASVEAGQENLAGKPYTCYDSPHGGRPRPGPDRRSRGLPGAGGARRRRGAGLWRGRTVLIDRDRGGLLLGPQWSRPLSRPDSRRATVV